MGIATYIQINESSAVTQNRSQTYKKDCRKTNGYKKKRLNVGLHIIIMQTLLIKRGYKVKLLVFLIQTS